jgi:hypothetical protein
LSRDIGLREAGLGNQPCSLALDLSVRDLNPKAIESDVFSPKILLFEILVIYLQRRFCSKQFKYHSYVTAMLQLCYSYVTAMLQQLEIHP